MPEVKKVPVYRDKFGRRQGEYKGYYNQSDGSGLQVHCYFLNNQIYGEYKEWHENGNLRVEAQYDKDRTTGTFKCWFENGQLKIHSLNHNGCKHGEYKQWFDDGFLKYHRIFKNDEDITHEVEEAVEDIENITDDERTFIKLKWDIECLS